MTTIVLADPPAERAVLSGIYNYGINAYLDVADIVSEKTFTIDSNAVIFKCIKHAFENNEIKNIDFPTVLSAASEVGLSHVFDKTEEISHLHSVMGLKVGEDNIRKFAAKIRKLEIARLLHGQLEVANDEIVSIKGDESLSHILGIAEDAIFNFSSLIDEDTGEPQTLGDGLDEYLEYLSENQVEQIGVSTGYPTYDFAIGGGLRRGTVNVIGARPKIGKTLFADNVGLHIAGNLGVPVLNMDTEMIREDHQHRSLAIMSEVGITDIETGGFSNNADKSRKVHQALDKIRDMPYFHKCIGGMPFEEQLAVMRRWLAKEVGLNPDGTAKDCVIIYDYIKLMTSDTLNNNMAEFQALGFMMTGLHNFAIRYKVPLLSFVQLNRDGITRESTDAASGSDRIIWLCSNFTIYKRKSDEEIAEDGVEAGNRKLVPVIARHGAGLADGDYININMKDWCGKIEEGQTLSELRQEEEFVVEEEPDDEIPF